MSGDRPDWKALDRDARWAIIKPLLAEGLSMSQVAAQFRGVGRNAIIGYVHRREAKDGAVPRPRLVARTLPLARGPREVEESKPKPVKPAARDTALRRRVNSLNAYPKQEIARPPAIPNKIERDQAFQPLEGVTHIQITELPLYGRCRWPIEADGSRIALACGQQTLSETHVYCAAHARLSRASSVRQEVQHGQSA